MRWLLALAVITTSCSGAPDGDEADEAGAGLRILDAPTEVVAEPNTSPQLDVTLELTGFDAPRQFRLDNFTTDLFVVGEIEDRATAAIALAGCTLGATAQGNFLYASIEGSPEVNDRADISVRCP